MNGWQVDTTAWFAADSLAGAAPLVAETATGEYVDAIPLPAGPDLGIISSTLLCVVIYFTLLATVQLRGRGTLSALCVYFVRKKNSEQLVAKKIAPNTLPLFCSLCLSFTSFSLFVVYLERGSFVPVEVARYLCYFLAYHFVLLGVISLLGWVFKARDCAREVSINAWVYNAVPGIALSPGVLSLFYARAALAEALLVAITLLLALYVILRLLRWAKILFEHRVPIFYLILYLCALEILPLLVLFKMLAGGF
jgi:hypothetical protein